MVINQRKYTIDLLKETGKLRCKLISTPIDDNHELSIKGKKKLKEKEKGKYQGQIGELIFITLTRFDITYIMNVMSQFVHASTDIHM